jgi:hypothetical protein
MKGRHERYSGAAFRPYALAIGQMALAWNDLQERLSLLFDQVLGMPGHNASLKIWHSTTQDRAAREMLKAILDEVPLRWLRGFPNAQDDIEWVLAKTENLENERNNIIHAPLIFVGHPPNAGQLPNPLYPPKVVPQWFLGHKRAKNLLEKDILVTYRRCRDTALILRDFVVDITFALGQRSAPPPWPKRPSLPNRGQKTNRRGRRPQSRKAVHRPPPQSSPR